MKTNQSIILRKSIEIESTAVVILLYLFRATVPFLKFPFLLIFSCLVIYTITNYRNSILITFSEYIKIFNLSILLLGILLVSFVFSNKLYLVAFKDTISSVLLISLFYFMIFYIKTKSEFNLFIKKLFRLIIVFALIISILILYKILGDIPDRNSLSINSHYWTSFLLPISSDYNFVLIPVLYGLICVLYIFIIPLSGIKKGLMTLILIIFSATIVLSGSRRGAIILASIIIALLFIQIFSFIKWNETIKIAGQNSKWFTSSFMILTFLMLGFVFIVPVKMKRNVFNSLGISIIRYRNLSSVLLSRYGIFSEADYNYFVRVVWNEDSNSLILNSYWGDQSNKIVSPFSGINQEILPANSVGYKMDKTSEVSTMGDNAYSIINITNLFNKDTLSSRDEFYYASIYCYVSKDFNGSWARISAGNVISGKVFKEYDLKRKGEWQKLKISFRTTGQISPVYLIWSKNMATDFYNLQGNVIFANPEIKITKAIPTDPDSGWGSRISSLEYPLAGKNVEIVPPHSIGYKMDNTCNASVWDGNAHSYTDVSSLYKGELIKTHDNFYSASVYCYASADFDGSSAYISTEGDITGNKVKYYDLNKKGTWQKIQIEFRAKSGVPPVYLYWAKDGVTNFDSLKGYIIFAYPEYKIKTKKGSLTSFITAPSNGKL